MKLQHTVCQRIRKYAVFRRLCGAVHHKKLSVPIPQWFQNIRISSSRFITYIHRTSADSAQQAVFFRVFMHSPEHIPVTAVQFIMIQWIVGILQEMFWKTSLIIRTEVITVSGYSCGRPCQDILHSHSHTVDDRTIHARSSALQCLIHPTCRHADWQAVFKVIRNCTLTIYFHETDSFPVQHLIPISVKLFSRKRTWKSLAVDRSIKIWTFFYIQSASRYNTSPVAAQGMPYTEPTDICFFLNVLRHFPESFREFPLIRHKIRQ